MYTRLPHALDLKIFYINLNYYIVNFVAHRISMYTIDSHHSKIFQYHSVLICRKNGENHAFNWARL